MSNFSYISHKLTFQHSRKINISLFYKQNGRENIFKTFVIKYISRDPNRKVTEFIKVLDFYQRESLLHNDTARLEPCTIHKSLINF